MAITDAEFTNGLHETLYLLGFNFMEEFRLRHFDLVDHGQPDGLVLEIWNEQRYGPLPDDATLAQRAADRAARLQAQADKQAQQQQVALNAKITAAGLPGWASWTVAEAEAWLVANVEPEIAVDHPKTYQALGALVKMVLALRNAVWADLEGSE